MPFLIFIIILLLTVIFWDWVVLNGQTVGTLATAFAFIATAWNAYEARKSAKAAFSALQLTTESLFEMRKSAFKQWFDSLLNQHDALCLLAKQIIDKHKINLNSDELHRLYYPLVKQHEVIQYVKHIINIFEYVDSSFYIDGECLKEKRAYVSQLIFKIPPQMKLIIAIFGLKIDYCEHINSEKLCCLLNKYDFFNDEIFFDDAYSNMPYLDTFINLRFNKIFKSRMINYFDNIIKSYYVPSDVKRDWMFRRPQLVPSVLMNYKTPCSPIINDYFEKLPLHVRNYFEEQLKTANDRVTHFDVYITRLIGYSIVQHYEDVPSEKNRLNDRNDVIAMAEDYIEKRKSNQLDYILEDIYFKSDEDIIPGHHLIVAFDDYEYKLSLIKINENKDNDNLLNRIYTESSSMVNEYKREILKLGDYAK
ncbi:hypothetical protein M1V37_02550 [Escherichia coli]|uniref:hypothetical protein n=1 Tax=Escherichia coli TaxID=562 RepID=UPI0017ED4581|nr:hypothetical protein [Escherichia coli]EKD0894723.1 hypothetical protein [Shigella sonnei]EFH9775847.1 hypothetical protein [Escherichia coli]MCO4990852.1 hypothetical protein [Escherichia coli]MDY8174604.1 hypothetical protein [Escherichia coli]MED9849705.1 hypothetical protein [Escherichia coli]